MAGNKLGHHYDWGGGAKQKTYTILHEDIYGEMVKVKGTAKQIINTILNNEKLI